MAIKNFYTANTAEPGDVFLVVIKAVVMPDGTYRLYRCPYESDEIPQGDRLYDNDMRNVGEYAGRVIFPVLHTTKGSDNG